jgi:integrase
MEAAMKITKRLVDGLGQNTVVWDKEIKGFGVRRQTDGAFYILRYRHKGKQRQITIGRHGSPWTVETARRKAISLLGGIVEGSDPLAEREAMVPETLGPTIERYLSRKKPDLKPRAFVEVERHLARQSSSLHSLALTDVDRRTIAQLLGEIEEGSGPVARNAVRASLSAFWTWAIREGLTEVNPVSGTGKAAQTSRDRVLSEGELRTIWHALGDDAFGDIIRLLILTGQRRQEIGGLRWVEIAGDSIILPPERTKNSRRHELPLSPQAARIIARQPRSGEYVFGDFMNWHYPKTVLDRRCGLPHWTLHDLRRTAATMMHDRLDILPHVVEAILNHVSGHKAGVAGVYNRAKYLSPMRDALVRWANHVERIVTAEGAISTNVSNVIGAAIDVENVEDIAKLFGRDPASVVDTKVCDGPGKLTLVRRT